MPPTHKQPTPASIEAGVSAISSLILTIHVPLPFRRGPDSTPRRWRRGDGGEALNLPVGLVEGGLHQLRRLLDGILRRRLARVHILDGLPVQAQEIGRAWHAR